MIHLNGETDGKKQSDKQDSRNKDKQDSINNDRQGYRKQNNVVNNRDLGGNQNLGGDVKIIMNKKDEVKNERLMNYINEKKRAI